MDCFAKVKWVPRGAGHKQAKEEDAGKLANESMRSTLRQGEDYLFIALNLCLYSI